MSELDILRTTYARALLAFHAASADLILNYATDVPPSDALIAAEESARDALIAARRELWGAYARRMTARSSREQRLHVIISVERVQVFPPEKKHRH